MLVLATLALLAQAPLDAAQQQQLEAARAFFLPGAKNPDSSRLTANDLQKKCGFTVPIVIDPSTIPVARKLASKVERAPDLVWTDCLSAVEAVMYSCEDPALAAGIKAQVKKIECRASESGARHGAYTLENGTLTMTFGATPATDMDTILGRGQAFLKAAIAAAPKAVEGKKP